LEILIELCTAQPSERRTNDAEEKATCRRRKGIDGAATNCNGIAAAVDLGQNEDASTKQSSRKVIQKRIAATMLDEICDEAMRPDDTIVEIDHVSNNAMGRGDLKPPTGVQETVARIEH
jgi:hypothetical protein